MKATVLLGGGRITSALVAGLRLSGYQHPIMVHDRHRGKLQRLRRESGVGIETSLQRAVETAQMLIIAVRPDSVRAMLQEIAEFRIPQGCIVVSLAAGIPLSTLNAALRQPVRWARAMPSPVCRSGQGLTALTFGRGFNRKERGEIRGLFAAVGAVVEIPEKQFDAFTVTYSSSHGYHALAHLVSAAETIGLDRKTARLAAAHALADGIAAWRESNLSLEKLLEEAATPGGVAAAVMRSMDAARYPKIVLNSLRAGLQQARKNARDR